MTTPRGPILVIGATGNQGGQVVQALLADGWMVHALTRNPHSTKAQALQNQGIHLVTGDMADLPMLTHAFKEVTGIFSVQNFWDLGLKREISLGINVIRAAENAGNQPHIVYSSGLGAEKRQGVAAIDGKAAIEEKLSHSSLPFTILRPGLFMDDFLGASLPFSRPVQRILHNHRPLVGRLFLATLRAIMPRDSQVPLTTLSDVGKVAAWAFDTPAESLGTVFEVIGSSETAETLCALWAELTDRAILRIPGMGLGIQVAHPKMAALLKWLSRFPYAPPDLTFALTSYPTWLHQRI